MQHHRSKTWLSPLAAAALMLADLDGFKKINDTHGHATGLRVGADPQPQTAAEYRTVMGTEKLMTGKWELESVFSGRALSSVHDVFPTAR